MSHDELIVNCDPCFDINPATRTITCNSGKTCIMQYDHNSERFGFRMPRYVEGHDMSICDRVEVHYINEDKNTKEIVRDTYIVQDLMVSKDDEEKIEFSWLISQKATKLFGALAFLVRFSCFSEDKPEYIWNTSIFSGITISQGLYNTEIVIEENADLIETMRIELKSYIDEQEVSLIDLENLEAKTSKKYELIQTITVADDGVTTFTFDKDINGNSFKLDAVSIYIECPSSPTTTTSWRLDANKAESANVIFYKAPSGKGTLFVAKAERLTTKYWWTEEYENFANNYAYNKIESSNRMYGVDYITKLILKMSNSPVGTVVTICGRRV